MNKNLLIRKISLLLASFSSLVISLILYIKSYDFYADEYGTDISFNEDYNIALIISLALFIFLIFALVRFLKGTETHYNNLVYLSTSALISFYSLGKFFKALFKAINKGVAFAFSSYQAYLYIGIVTLFIVVYFLFAFLSDMKNKNV